MRALLLFAVLAGSALATLVCPPKYFSIEDRCIRPYTLNANDYLDIIMDYAQAACALDGAHLPIIRSDEDNDMFTRIAQTFLQPSGTWIYLVLGVVCDDETEMTRWVDGSPIEYQGPPGSDPALFNCSLSPTMPTSMLPENQWKRLLLGDAHLFTSLCVLEEQIATTEEVVTEAPDNKCGDYERMEDGMDDDTPCFKVFTEPLSWENAQKKCEADFGSLIAISSAEENSFFWNVATTHKFTGGMHIGAHQCPDDSTTWTWIDGEIPITSNTYNNFIRSFPIAGSGKCASMVTESVAAAWVNVDCYEDELPFICQRGDFSLIPSSCPNAAPKAGEEIFSPSYPKSDISCEYFLTVSEDKLVEVEIISLISEKNVDYLEIREGTSGMKSLANLTGTLQNPTKFTTSKSNVLRVNWKPVGTTDGRGFKIRYIEVDKTDIVEPATVPVHDEETTTKSATPQGIFAVIVTLLYSLTTRFAKRLPRAAPIKAFTCERIRMRALLLVALHFVSTTALTQLSWPLNYFFFEDKCIRPFAVMADDTLLNLLPLARESCAQDGAHLPMIRSHEENESYARLVNLLTAPPKGRMIRVPLDLVCDANTTLMTWADGTSVDYVPYTSDGMKFDCTQYNHSVYTEPMYVTSTVYRWTRVELDTVMSYTSLCVHDSEVVQDVTTSSATSATTLLALLVAILRYDSSRNGAPSLHTLSSVRTMIESLSMRSVFFLFGFAAIGAATPPHLSNHSSAKILPIDSVSAASDDVQCPSGFTDYLGWCAYLFHESFMYSEAAQFCSNKGTYAPSIHSESDYNFWNLFAHINEFWFDAYCPNQGEPYAWLDKTPTNYYGPKNELGNCQMDKGMQMLPSGLHAEKLTIGAYALCSAPTATSGPTTGDDVQCASGFSNFRGWCVYQSPEKMTYPEAVDVCASMGTFAPSIHSESEYNFWNLFGYTHDYWFDAYCPSEGQPYAWLDKTPTNYLGEHNELSNCQKDWGIQMMVFGLAAFPYDFDASPLCVYEASNPPANLATTTLQTVQPTATPPATSGFTTESYCDCNVDKFGLPDGWNPSEIWLDIVIVLDISMAMGQDQLDDAEVLIESLLSDGLTDFLTTDVQAKFFTRLGVITMPDNKSGATPLPDLINIIASDGYYFMDSNNMQGLQAFCKANCFCGSPDMIVNGDSASGGCYHASLSGVPFNKAKAACSNNFHGFLATVHNEDKGRFLQKLLNSSKSDYFWIGYEKTDDGVWQWEDQSSDSYTNWDEDEPSSSSVAKCAYIDSSKTTLPWGAGNCQVGFPYVCQSIPCSAGHIDCM
ncbi:hypothetical protein PRIPAC_83713 [Pristionchus pacificus]|uniref:CUB domain-containing protein n=1 Tax=Pristionchus pacificus TaxID=54126 RepID=A0A2A6BTT1_PRIPA|nr:hypothetical protein PRIPAC_83713 [Pristionchus pacificus]|eukprot:PDM69310.1 CUB domain-containing protein [Pristionchus pacificus]